MCVCSPVLTDQVSGCHRIGQSFNLCPGLPIASFPRSALSVYVDRPILQQGRQAIRRLRNTIQEVKARDAGRLRDEWRRLVEGLAAQQQARANNEVLANPGASGGLWMCARARACE